MSSDAASAVNGGPGTRPFPEGIAADELVEPWFSCLKQRLGLASNFSDLHHFMAFAAEFVDITAIPADLPPRTAC